eukprot:scpid32213/ scgid22814/ 
MHLACLNLVGNAALGSQYIQVPVSTIHLLSTSSEDLSMSETAVQRICKIYPRMNFPATAVLEYGVVNVGQESGSVEWWSVSKFQMAEVVAASMFCNRSSNNYGVTF